MKRIIFRTITRNELIAWAIGVLVLLGLGVGFLTKVLAAVGH